MKYTKMNKANDLLIHLNDTFFLKSYVKKHK